LAEKYRYTFKSFDGYDCVVKFDFDGYTGSSTTLVATDRPFVLSEFNTDEDIFKPVRPMVAEMSFIASASGVSIDDFLADADNDIVVTFDLGAFTGYWKGYLSQDDFQEVWQDTDHIITLRATDGIGYLKNNIITDEGAEFDGKYTPLETIIAAMGGTAVDFGDYYVYSSLYHDSMSYYTGNYSGIEQCYINGKTFLTGESEKEYDDAYTALEKVNTSFSQTIFQHNGKWRILRVEDMFVPATENIIGYRNNGGTKSSATGRFDNIIAVDKNVKPVSPQMLRFIKRKPKVFKTQYDYNQITEVILNQSWSRGAFDTNIGSNKVYDIDDWTFTPSAITGGAKRIEIYSGGNGVLTDNYISLKKDITYSNLSELKSTAVKILTGESFNFSVDSRWQTDFSTTIEFVVVDIRIVTPSNTYYLIADGTWTTNVLDDWGLKVKYNGSDGVEPLDWTGISVETYAIATGDLFVTLRANTSVSFGSSGGDMQFKGLSFTVNTAFNTSFNVQLTGVRSVYTKSQDLRNENEYTVYFDDGVSHNYQGSIYEQDQETMTDLKWFRGRYPAEQLGFRRQNVTARWMNERFDRSKIDANFYGLTFDSFTKPIGLLQTIIFEDDDPNKIYWIANLKEIDFQSATWSATLLEIWDANRDEDNFVLKEFDADPTAGNYIPSGEFVIPFTVVSAADLTYDGTTKKFTYNGATSITELVILNITGDINTINPLNTTATFKLYINDVEVDSATHDASTTPSEFSISLNGTYTINPTNNIYVTISSNVGDFDINGGEFSFNYEYPGALTYDTYTDEYIYK
jgi:hypothetical protein